MSETIRNAKVLRAVAALVLCAAMALGIFVATERSHASTNEEYCYNFLTGTMGLNTAAAAGLLANFAEESSFNPNINGDSGSSYGLCQWNKSRKTDLINYCSSRGLDYSTLQGQLSYLYYELQTDYPSLLSTLRSTANNSNGAYNAGYRFCYDFERPAAKESKSQSRGSSASGTYYPKYANTVQSVSTTTAPATTPAAPAQNCNYVVKTGGSNLNVRSQPNVESSVVGKLADGTCVNVTNQQNGFGYVNQGGVAGWVSMQYLGAI